MLLLTWAATTLWLLSSFAGTFPRYRWWLTSVDDHVGHNNVVPEGSGQRPGSDTDSYESGVLLKTTHNYAQLRPALSVYE